MAKNKKDIENNFTDGSIEDAFKILDELNPDATFWMKVACLM